MPRVLRVPHITPVDEEPCLNHATSTFSWSMTVLRSVWRREHCFREPGRVIVTNESEGFCDFQTQRDRIAAYVEDIEQKNTQLEEHIAEIKTLRGLIPSLFQLQKSARRRRILAAS